MTAGEVLSQSEIDALLAALSTGEMSAEELKKKKKDGASKRTTSGGRFGFRKTRFAV